MPNADKGQYEREYSRKWSDDDILDALHMRDENYTMKEIGDHFGFSRNAVIGMINRVLSASKG